MKPLAFLVSRSLVNGIRRAFSSARRVIGLLVMLAYYYNFIMRPFSQTPAVPVTPGRSPLAGKFEYHPQYLEAGIFGVFALLTLLMMLSSFRPRGGFRPADIDVLFPTPLNPKVVVGFRILRDYLITLFFPIFVALCSGRGARLESLNFLSHFPANQAHLAGRLLTFAYFLLSLFWVTVGFASGIALGRDEQNSDRNFKLTNWSIFIVVLAVIAYASIRISGSPSVETAVAVSQNPLLRIVFFTATGATQIAMAPMGGSWLWGGLSVVAIAATIVGCVRFTLNHSSFLYDQAASKPATIDAAKMRQAGDTYGLMAQQATKGKIKRGRISQRIAKIRVRGATALIWKELVLHTRTGLWQYILFGPIAIMLVLAPVMARSESQLDNSAIIDGLFLGMLGLVAFIVSSINTQSGFIELLRRGDFLKPLPFGPTRTVFWEVAAKTLPTLLISVIASVAVILFKPALILTAISGIFLAPSLALVLSGGSLIVILLFPEVDDPTQRGFRGLMNLLGAVIVASPTVLVIGGAVFFKAPVVLAAVPMIAINVLIAVGLSAIAGGLYGSYNPSE